MKWLKNLFYRAPEGFEDAYKSAVKRVKQSQQTPETDPFLSCYGKVIEDVGVFDSQYPEKGKLVKIYFTDGTVLVNHITAKSTKYTGFDGELVVDMKCKSFVNSYTVEKGRYVKLEYKEVGL